MEGVFRGVKSEEYFSMYFLVCLPWSKVGTVEMDFFLPIIAMDMKYGIGYGGSFFLLDLRICYELNMKLAD